MRRRNLAILLGVLSVTGTASFLAGRVTRAQRPGAEAAVQSDWLPEAPATTQEAERQFQNRVREMTTNVRSQKTLLSSILADPHGTEERILSQVEEVMHAHEILLRAVGQHLTELRANLPEQQRRDLMQSCADSLQGGMQRRYRWRGGGRGGNPWQNGDHQFPGGLAHGRDGRGVGYGRRYRDGQQNGYGLARRLQLTDAQIVLARRHDPNFEEECTRLKNEVCDAHIQLLAGFQDPRTADETLLAGISRLVEAHNNLEKRVARHVVQLRPYLSSRQMNCLIGLCEGRHGPDSSTATSTEILGSVLTLLCPQ